LVELSLILELFFVIVLPFFFSAKVSFSSLFFVVFFVEKIVFPRFSGKGIQGYLDRNIGLTRFDFRGMCMLKN